MSRKPFFVGRETELALLQTLQNSEQSDLVAIIGRRRVGKTYLVKNAFKSQFSFHITGVKDADKTTMLKAFATKIEALSKSALPVATPD
jgi:hypothetical protein